MVVLHIYRPEADLTYSTKSAEHQQEMNCTPFNLGIPEDVVHYPQLVLHQLQPTRSRFLTFAVKTSLLLNHGTSDSGCLQTTSL